MSGAVVKFTKDNSVLYNMADRYGMMPDAFEATVRATCMRPDRDGRIPTPAEFAAFLLVAKEYKLNPITKEIYAFAGKGGGIVPIVSIDGWVNLVNSHGKCDGFDFEMEHDDDGKLVSCTCKMYRTDRTHPVVVTEYLAECKRGTDPWKMEHRMLRHKAMIQASRYAFGFSGIYDEDEGRAIAEGAIDVTPRVPSVPRVPSPDDQKVIEHQHEDGRVIEEKSDNPAKNESTQESVQDEPEEPHDEAPQGPNPDEDYEAFIEYARDLIFQAKTVNSLEYLFNRDIASRDDKLMPPDMTELVEMYEATETRLKAKQ